jgi:hypothetical protein
MSVAAPLEIDLLPGAAALLALHARELPQRDDLCGAFCGSLAIGAAGLRSHSGEEIDQDTVALAAGSIVSGVRDAGTLPHGETGRRDYRLQLPFVDDPEISGTTAAGVAAAIAEVSAGLLEGIPYRGPWNTDTLAGLFELAASLERPVTLIANLATHHLWGAGASIAELLAYLLEGQRGGPPPDWEVGHFACVVGRVRGAGGTLYALADTYPALGNRGVHFQPQENLAAAIERTDKPAGGVIAVVFTEDAAVMRMGAERLGLAEGPWDNGTVTAVRTA